MPLRRIQTVNDLAQLPEDELRACLSALRGAIGEAKRRHAIALREEIIAPDTPLAFCAFDWRPRGEQRLDIPGRLTPETPIDELPLRAMARQALRALHIYCVEGLSAISEGELLSEPAIGQATTNRLREVLARAGLKFTPNPDGKQRALEENEAVLALAPEARASVIRDAKDSAPLSALGLKRSTLTRALDHGCQTVGDLRKLSLPRLCEGFSKRETREIHDVLMLTGRPFAASASPLELWRHGLVDASELAAPTASHTPIEELRPWLGPTVDSLSAQGVHTLDSLRNFIALGRSTSFRGIGVGRVRRIAAFLDVHVDWSKPTARASG